MQSRSDARWLWGLLTAAAVLIAAAGTFFWMDRTHFQRKANAMEWRWSDEKATIDYCLKNNLHGYTARASGDEIAWLSEREITFLDGTEAACTIRGHTGTVFAHIGDVVYVANVELFTTECKLYAYDLKARKELWARPLRGNPLPDKPDPPPVRTLRSRFGVIHLRSVNIEVDRGVILVFGYDANGRFIEYVDPRDGKTIGHKALPNE